MTGREPEKRIKHRERCTLASRIIWNRHGHECSRIWKLSGNFIKKCQIYWGRLFFGPNLVSFNRAVIPLFELSFLTKSQKGGILIFDRGLRYVDVFLHESGFQENRAFFSIFLYSLILPVNKYHLGPGFQVIQLQHWSNIKI